MAEHQQNRIIHLGMSLLTIVVTVGAVLAAYYSTQSMNREMMAEFKATLASQHSRIAVLEVKDGAATVDRLAVERRIATLETVYTQTLAALTEIKADVRAIREDRRRTSP